MVWGDIIRQYLIRLNGVLNEDRKVALLKTDARQGIARAQRLLALRYLRGRGVPKDEAIAFYWMQLAAHQHFGLAQRSLGEFYENGNGIDMDVSQATHWYNLAAQQGDPIAREHLQRLSQPSVF